jgi:hypothetical protein
VRKFDIFEVTETIDFKLLIMPSISKYSSMRLKNIPDTIIEMTGMEI